MSNRTRVFSQDKDISGKLSKPTVKNVVFKFKEQYADRKDNTDNPISGFELNGGEGMTKGAKEEWEEFDEWCQSKNMKSIYNTKDELFDVRNRLRNRVDNKNKLKN